MEQDQRLNPIVDRVDTITGRPPRVSLIVEGRCVIEPNKNEREPYKILDPETLNRVLRSLAC
jgi:hypothetical protein